PRTLHLLCLVLHRSWRCNYFSTFTLLNNFSHQQTLHSL
ncbi:unnamed protein product, partial [Staurois parvus]